MYQLNTKGLYVPIVTLTKPSSVQTFFVAVSSCIISPRSNEGTLTIRVCHVPIALISVSTVSLDDRNY